MKHGVLEFAGFRLDPTEGRLRYQERDVALQPKCFALLRALAQADGAVCSKQALIDEVWPDVSVTESSLLRAMSILRASLREAAGNGDLVRTPPEVQSPRGFVGRGPELAALAASLDRIHAGHCAGVQIRGEPGVGKSRLALEFATVARNRGAHAILATCHEADGGVAYAALAQLAAQAAAIVDAADVALPRSVLEDLATLVPSLADGEASARRAVDPELRRIRAFRAFASLIDLAVSVRPLVLIVDDLQWIDPASLRGIEFFAAQLLDQRVMLLLCARNAMRFEAPELESVEWARRTLEPGQAFRDRGRHRVARTEKQHDALIEELRREELDAA